MSARREVEPIAALDDESSDRIKRQFGERVRQLRTDAGLSQEKLAELAGIHRNYVGDVERGRRNLALVNLVRISVALGADPAELVRGLRG